MDLNIVKKELGSNWDGFQQALREALKNDNAYLTQINNYLIENAGKQLRPVLSLLSALSCGKISQMSYNCAAVCEIIHTATLLHDDVADNGDVRRGVPTVKAVFNQAASVLAGDYWLARGMYVLIHECNSQILAYFTVALQELSEGEIIQMEKAENLDTDLADYYKIIARKTASLFIAAVKSGAASAGASSEHIEAISNYAYHLGLAFQMRDDIFDYSPKMNTGKIAGADLRERKITLPLLCAFKNNPAGEQQIRQLISGIENNIFTNQQISQLEMEIIEKVNAYIFANNGVQSAQVVLEQHIVKAIDFLSILPETISKQRLIQLAEYVGKRDN